MSFPNFSYNEDPRDCYRTDVVFVALVVARAYARQLTGRKEYREYNQ
jgi:hypothetical protein